MKKRFLTALVAASIIAATLAGCSLSDLGKEPAAPQYTLKTENYIYVVNENGEKVSGFNKDDIIKAIGDEIADSYYLHLETAFGNIAICSYDEYGADEVKLYAYNCETKDAVRFYSCENSPNTIDYYNGEVLVSFGDSEISFTIDEDLTYTENGPVMEDIFEILSDYVIENTRDHFDTNISVKKTLEETGYLLVNAKDGAPYSGYYMLKADGSLTPLPQIEGDDIRIADYSKEGIIYRTYKDWDFEKTCCLKLDTLQVTELPWEEQKISLGINNGKLYSCDNSETDVYMMDTHDYYAYDMEGGNEEKIFSTSSVPGSGYGLGRKGDFTVCGDNAFVLDVVDDKIKWLRIDLSGGEVSFADIDCPVRDVTPLEFGTVEYVGESYVCPKCGKLVGKCYEEYPVIDGRYSEHAEEINNSLKELLTAKTAKDLFASDDGDDEDDDCQWHDYEEGLFDTHESLVWDMHVINDRFLTVDITTYSMSVGGAHGYGTDYQLVYDLETGRNLKNRDIFKGSEEEFKTFIAEKTREYAENSDEDERGRFYSSDPDDIYNSAYENASFEDTNLQYHDDHVDLVYLQYEMGPYAAGVFYIEIPYEEFIGANTLILE